MSSHRNECVECGIYRAEFWVCDECRAIDMDPASDHDPDAYFAAEEATDA